MSNSRRDFLGAAASSLAAAELALAQPASAQSNVTLTPQAADHTTFAALKQINAGLLNVGYAEAGPADGKPVVLLHGWPYDIHSYVDVAPLLAAAGYRVIIPYLRGYGSTRFLSSSTVRNAQQAVVAVDIIALMDALKIKQAIIGGFDWGARTACIMAALWPDRCKAMVSVSGYLITNRPAALMPLAPMAELGWWYQYYFSTQNGLAGYSANTNAFNRLIWTIVSPKWNFDDDTFARTAQAFSNPDHVAIVIHNYRWRISVANGEPKYDELEWKLQAAPAISIPVITISSDFDGPNINGTAYRSKFTGKYAHRIFDGIGHNVPQEAPQAFAQAIQDVDSY